MLPPARYLNAASLVCRVELLVCRVAFVFCQRASSCLSKSFFLSGKSLFSLPKSLFVTHRQTLVLRVAVICCLWRDVCRHANAPFYVLRAKKIPSAVSYFRTWDSVFFVYTLVFRQTVKSVNVPCLRSSVSCLE